MLQKLRMLVALLGATMAQRFILLNFAKCLLISGNTTHRIFWQPYFWTVNQCNYTTWTTEGSLGHASDSQSKKI